MRAAAPTAKAAAVAAALVAASLAAWLFLRDERPRELVTTRFVGGASSATSEPTRAPTLPSAVEPARLPPSQFRRRTLTDDEWQRYSDVEDSPLLERDAFAYYRYRPGVDVRIDWPEHPRGFFRAHTNSYGLRNIAEIAEIHPDLRILVTGDSHSDGVCDASDTFTALLERELAERAPGRSVEALNAAVGGYSLYHYLGALERWLPLEPDVFVVGVYGGNDFEEGLTLHHLYHGTTRPPGSALFGDLLDAAFQVNQGAVVQGMLSVKYFTQHPDQVAVAVQMARDVSLEIAVTCWRNGIHPIFVYIPPLQDVAWSSRADELERIAHALELGREDLLVSERLADAYLAALEELRVDVVDMRETFRASAEDLYWRTDYHLALAGHRAIAERLAPVVEAARPASTQRVRGVGRHEDSASLASDGRAPRTSPEVEQGTRPQQQAQIPVPKFDPRWDLDGVDAAAVDALFELGPRLEFDPQTLVRYAAGVELGSGVRTNGLGLLGASEPSDRRPDLRVLLVTDESVFAAGDEGAPCGKSIEEALREQRERVVECLDATTPGWSFFEYLGALERFAALAPDALVVVVDGANDFADVGDVELGLLGIERQRTSDEPPARRRIDEPRTCIDIAKRYSERPNALVNGVRVAAGLTLEIARRCRESGRRLLVVFLPTASDPRVQTCRAEVGARAKEAGLERADLRLLERGAEAYLGALAEHELEIVDFGDVVEASSEALYDVRTLRLSALGRQRLAQTIARRLDAAPTQPR